MTPAVANQVRWAQTFIAAMQLSDDAMAWLALPEQQRIPAAGVTFAHGPGGPSVGGAPLPYARESLEAYLDRVVGGSWAHSSGPLSQLGKVGQVLSGVADALGLVGAGQFVYVLSALAGNGSPAVLAQSLKADFDRLQSSGALADAVENGDWLKVWNLATSDGQNLWALSALFNGDPPDAQGRARSGQLIPSSYFPPPTKKAQAMRLLGMNATGPSVGARIALAATPNTPANADAIARLSAAATGVHVATAVGLAAPPPTTNNPQGGRTIFGIPVVDVGVGAVALAALGFLAKKEGWL